MPFSGLAPKRSLLRRFRDSVRANFVAGMFVALPLGITVAALIWLWERLDGPLKFVFGYTDVPGAPWERLSHALAGAPHYEDVVVPLLGLCILMLAVLALGVVIRSLFGRFLLTVLENFVTRLPLVGLFYTSLRQLAEAFVDAEGKSKFQSAVLVQFPMEGSWVIGFVTSTAFPPLAQALNGTAPEKAPGPQPAPSDIVTVFIPTTPLPTQGFTLVLPRAATRPLGLTVEEAIKLVVSGGVMTRPEGHPARPRALAAAPE